MTLSQIVDDQKLRDGFQRFLDRNLMGEQLLFVVEVDKFSQLDCPSQKFFFILSLSSLSLFSFSLFFTSSLLFSFK